MTLSTADIETILKTELAGAWDENQLAGSDSRFDTFVHCDALRVSKILSLIPRDRDVTALEVGAGYGYVIVPFSRSFPHATIHAIEFPGRTYTTSDRYRTMLANARTSLALCDITSEPLPYAERAFSDIICSEVIEHIPPSAIPHMMKELYRVLRPGGQLILTTPNALRLRNRLRFLAGRSIFESPVYMVGGTFGHLREYTRNELAEMASWAGFTRIAHIPDNIRFPLSLTLGERALSVTGAILARLSPSFQDFLCLVATK